MTPEEIHEFWFADSVKDADKARQRMKLWFGSAPAVDAVVSERFAPTVQAAASGGLVHWTLHPRSCLALIIVLDQFPRNMYRGTAAAFVHDAHALNVTRRGVAAEFLKALTTIEQAFFLMPFQHVENVDAQGEGLRFFEGMAQSAAAEWRPLADDILRYAQLHFDIVSRFGRFPHRNQIVGRPSTPQERAFLETSTESFGQSP